MRNSHNKNRSFNDLKNELVVEINEKDPFQEIFGESINKDNYNYINSLLKPKASEKALSKTPDKMNSIKETNFVETKIENNHGNHFFKRKEGSNTKVKKQESMRNNLFENFFKPAEDTEQRIYVNDLDKHENTKKPTDFKINGLNSKSRKKSSDFLEIIDDCINRLCVNESYRFEKSRKEKISILKKLALYEEKIKELFTQKKLLLLDLSIYKNREKDFSKDFYLQAQEIKKLKSQNSAISLKLRYTQETLTKERQEAHESLISLKKILLKFYHPYLVISKIPL